MRLYRGKIAASQAEPLAQKRLQDPRIFLRLLHNNAILSFRRENLRVPVRTFSGQSTVEIPSPPDEADGLRYSHFLLVTKRYSPATSADNEHSVASKRGSFLPAYACR